MKMPEPVLYLRADCHLCEQVIALLEATGARWRPVDIVPGSGQELDYPFDEERLRRFLGL